MNLLQFVLVGPDDELIEMLRRGALEHDPVPASTRSLARSAFAMRNFDAQLAELLDDSVISAALPESVRSSGVRELRYQLPEHGTVTIRIIDRLLFGQLDRPDTCSVELVTTGDEHRRTTDTDVDGQFQLECPDGRFRLGLQFEDSNVVTEWLQL